MSITSGHWDGGLKMVRDNLGIIRFKKPNRQIELQQIILVALLCCQVWKLGVLGETWLSLEGEQIEATIAFPYNGRIDSILVSCVYPWKRRSVPMSSSWKQEKSTWAERRFPISSLLHYSLYRSGVSESRSWFYLLSCFVSGPSLPLQQGELLVLDTPEELYLPTWADGS